MDTLNQTDIWRRLLSNMNTAVLSFDDQLRLKYLNPAAEDLLAASARQITGHSLKKLMPGMDSFIGKLQQSLTSGRPYTEREVPLTLPPGRKITVDCTVTPLDDRKTPELLLELTQVDRHLRIAREENLLAQNHSNRQLMRGLAHEIKNPLGGLRGAAQLLERELPDASLKEYTEIIIGEADRLTALVNRMLGSNKPPNKRLINIHSVLERVRSLAQADNNDNITIKRDYDPSIPDIYADPDQLIQATLNIVNNALQAIHESKTEHATITLRTRTQSQITLGTHRHRLVIRIDIIDDGPGIPADLIDEIFYPMVTGRAEGTGLGLTIAQSLINQHHGLIECTSQPGNTIFTLYLPLENTHD